MLTIETVQRVSKLARLKVAEEELTSLAHDLSAVLANFEQLSQIDTQGVQPIVTPTEITVTLRSDIVEVSGSSEKCLGSAPEKAGRLYRVPPVV